VAFKLHFPIIIALLLTACQSGTSDPEAALRELNEAYTSGWKLEGLEAQKAAVMPLFTDDAVVLPSGGRFILNGKEELHDFWFPEGEPAATTIRFEQSVENIDVSGDVATFNGRSELEMTYKGQDINQSATYLAVARRTSSGEWQFSRLMWTDQPPKDKASE